MVCPMKRKSTQAATLPPARRLAAAALFMCLTAGCAATGTATDAALNETENNPAALWEEIVPPTVSSTDEIVLEGADLSPGTYWATVAPLSGTDGIVFRATRARFGAACDAWAEENLIEDGCLNDYAVETYPEAFVALSRDAWVSVALPDGPGRNLSLDAETLHRLVRGISVPTPEGYAWVPFPFVVKVDAGIVVAAHQLWVP